MNRAVPPTRRRPLLALLVAMLLAIQTASAQEMSMWVRESASGPASIMVDLWNSTHDTQIEITVIPDNQVVTKLATSVRTGDAPDLISLDLIYMPDFMRGGLLVDLTDQLTSDPNYATHANAYKELALYEDRLYGVGYVANVSFLVWNKDLFEQAGLDPERGPQTIYEVREMATQVAALGDDIYGFYFSGNCAGCNIFATSPMMKAGGADILPSGAGDEPLDGEAIAIVLEEIQAMWNEGVIPASAEVDAGENFAAAFANGNIGISGTGDFLLPLMAAEYPDVDFGVTLLPGLEPGQTSSFVGGDVLALPANSDNEAAAREFVAWTMTDEAQLEGLAANSIIPTRTDLLDNPYFEGNVNLQLAAEAVAVGWTPYVFGYNNMVNSDSSPWIRMLQQAIFDGDIEGALEVGKAEMSRIAAANE